MLNYLKEDEFEVATKLIFDGLSMAKTSMEAVLQSPISIKQIDYGDNQEEPQYKYYSGDDTKVHMIKTDLIGSLKGTSYLIFSQYEVDNICKACLPASVLENNTPENKMMIMGFLSEIDNLVAAAVITEFSNFLGLDIFGHVPSMQVVDAHEVDDCVAKDVTEFDSVVHFKAVFDGLELDISPDFVWIFQGEFADQIKKTLNK